MVVAIVAENLDYDGEILRVLLERLLSIPVERWRGRPTSRFDGCKSVMNVASTYLDWARGDDVRHAIVSVDNDGGSLRNPEHLDSHIAAEQSASPDGCRVCNLNQRTIPANWLSDGRRQCIVVPVQTMETWLPFLRGDAFSKPTPEKNYDRPALKKLFFGRPVPPIEKRLALALEQVTRPDALDRLRKRPSFKHFEAQLAAWR